MVNGMALGGTGEASSRAMPWRRLGAGADLIGVCSLVVLAGLAYAFLPGGSVLRVALAFTVLFFAPGYLAIEAAVGPAATRAAKSVRALVAVGISPAIVGLLALGTSVFPGGFRPAPLVVMLSVSCLALAAAALWRRRAYAQPVAAQPASA